MTCPRTAVPGSSRCTACGGARQVGRERARLAVRRAVNRAGGATCATCGRWHPALATRIDHAVPLVDGGRDEPGNVQVLCTACHADKTTTEAAERAHRRR
ncbi:HNH endonuclease [Crossiella sp. CA198]|uniref:HNH endonuclease n=1 Tax=Crossiella sp. CA198 TaxID=3455607 RepID=UPI003F8D8101